MFGRVLLHLRLLPSLGSLLDRVPTQSNLFSRGVILDIGATASILCRNFQESSLHLFCRCRFAMLLSAGWGSTLWCTKIFRPYFFSSFMSMAHVGADVVSYSSDILFSGTFEIWEKTVFFLEVYLILRNLLTWYYLFLGDGSKLGVFDLTYCSLVYFMNDMLILLIVCLGSSS